MPSDHRWYRFGGVTFGVIDFAKAESAGYSQRNEVVIEYCRCFRCSNEQNALGLQHVSQQRQRAHLSVGIEVDQQIAAENDVVQGEGLQREEVPLTELDLLAHRVEHAIAVLVTFKIS